MGNNHAMLLLCRQVLNLNSGELEWVCNHLGHDVNIDRNYYRLQTGVVEIAKVSKLLLVAEQGKLHKFKGQTLEQVDFNLDETI